MPEPSQAWRAYDAAELDRQYDARASVASFDAEYEKYVAASAPMLTDPRRRAGFVYDPRSGEKLDLYSVSADAPLFLWVHGGYWRSSSREDNAFAAAGLLEHGLSVAIIDYTLAPGATLDEIVRQVRTALAWLHKNGAAAGVDARRIHIGGSSAGGHLAGMLLAGGWRAALGVPEDVVGVALALSGLYDVEPLMHTKVNGWMALDREAALRNSPHRLIPATSSSLLLSSVGGLETDEFRRQTKDYAAAFAAAGRVESIAMPDHNHFDIALSLREPDGVLCRAVATAIKHHGSDQR